MDLRTLLVILHVIGTALGVGAATVSDYLFFKFAKDGQLDRDEFRILKTVSDLVWAGLLVILVSALGFLVLYLSGHQAIRATYSVDKLIAKAVIVVILLGNGFVLHRKVLPLFAARLGRSFATPKFIKQSTLIFSAGAVSAVSWYSALILGAWRGLHVSYLTLLGFYLLAVCVAALGATIIGRNLLLHLHRSRKV